MRGAGCRHNETCARNKELRHIMIFFLILRVLGVLIPPPDTDGRTLTQNVCCGEGHSVLSWTAFSSPQSFTAGTKLSSQTHHTADIIATLRRILRLYFNNYSQHGDRCPNRKAVNFDNMHTHYLPTNNIVEGGKFLRQN